MKITVPKTVKTVDVSEYAPGFAGLVDVWVNAPNEKVNAAIEAARGQDNDLFAASLAELLTGDPARSLNADEILDLQKSTTGDPDFMPWLVKRVFDVIVEHRQAVKKA